MLSGTSLHKNATLDEALLVCSLQFETKDPAHNTCLIRLATNGPVSGTRVKVWFVISPQCLADGHASPVPTPYRVAKVARPRSKRLAGQLSSDLVNAKSCSNHRVCLL